MRRRTGRWDPVLPILAGLATAVLVAFVLLPIVAIFARAPLSDLLDQLGSRVVLDALRVTLVTSGVALAVIVVFGTPAAYLLSRAPSRLSIAVATVFELPLVLPPAVAGIGLLVAFGRAGLLGGVLRAFGLSIPFTQVAVVMAMVFVALPLFARQAIAAFESLDPSMLAISRTLGGGAGATFGLVALPLARPGLAAGAALAWARAVGEFGATLIFAGSFQGRTQTLPLAIYAELQADFRVALGMAAILVAVSAGVLVAVKILLRSVRLDQGATWTERPFSKSTSVTV
jgi:molybdate transport system permease protein